jgi:hypothetical protein
MGFYSREEASVVEKSLLRPNPRIALEHEAKLGEALEI